MPVYVIDTLKPKNGLGFPVVEAVDVAVEGYSSLADAVTHFATDAMIAAINAELTGKANAADVTTSVANLQGQIDQIVISASAEAVVAPEVAAARVGEDGTEYETLKERLDTEKSATDDKLSTFDNRLAKTETATNTIGYDYTVNLCDPATAVDGKYVGAKYNHVGDPLVEGTNSAFAYNKIPVTYGKTYTVSSNAHRLITTDEDGIVLQTLTSPTSTITVDSQDAKYLYCSFRTATVSIDEYMIVEGSTLPSAFVPHLNNVRFNYPSVYDTFAQEVDDARTNEEGTEYNSLKERLDAESISKVISYDKTDNICNPYTAVVGKYIGPKYNRVGDPLVEGTSEAFAYNRIEVENGKTYTVSSNGYRLCIADKNDIVLQFENLGTTTITVNSSAAKYLYVSFRTAQVPVDKFMIVEGSSLPEKFEPYIDNLRFKYPSAYDKDSLVIVVDINGNGDYISLTECLKDYADNTEKKTIKILSGTYDIFEEYGGYEYMQTVDVEAGWRANSVFIPPNTHLIGIGQVTLQWAPTAAEIIDSNHANLFSPLNLSADNITVENLDIVCGNGRYCIHDECGVRWEAATANFQKITHKYINVRAIRTAKTYGNVQAYGGGSSAEGTYIYDNCFFSSPLTNVWSTHTNSNNVQGTGGCNFTFNNCVFETDTPADGTVRLINGMYFKNKNNVSFNGCYINGDIKIMYSGSETAENRVQTYAVTALKTTVNSIIVADEYGSAPYTPKVYT